MKIKIFQTLGMVAALVCIGGSLSAEGCEGYERPDGNWNSGHFDYMNDWLDGCTGEMKPCTEHTDNCCIVGRCGIRQYFPGGASTDTVFPYKEKLEQRSDLDCSSFGNGTIHGTPYGMKCTPMVR